MATTFASLGLGDLPLHEKRMVAIHLLHEVHVLETFGRFETREEMFAELDRRCAEADAHPETLVSWEEVYANAKERLSQPRHASMKG